MGLKISGKEKRTPIWFMRQAGRSLPEYLEVRGSVNSFLDLCYDPFKCAQVTKQPIDRFGLDAAIIFSDILVLPHLYGWDVDFLEGIGPRLKPFRDSSCFLDLSDSPNRNIENVYEAISSVRSSLPKDTSLIGFVGGPWTVASYMVEGKSPKESIEAKKLLYSDPETFGRLIDFLTDISVSHLKGQIKSGADVVQIFDSFAGHLPEAEYRKFVIEPTQKIVSSLKRDFPEVPIIGFPRGSGIFYGIYAEETSVDVLSLDQYISPSYAKSRFQGKVLQGNLDPVLLTLEDKALLEKAAYLILSELRDRDLVFNLGHGVLPDSRPDNIGFLVEYVRNFGK